MARVDADSTGVAGARLHGQADLDAALDALVRQDRRLAPIREVCAPVVLRRHKAGFAGLSAIIVGQQLSLASAAAIWRRLAGAFDPFQPDVLHTARVERLRRLGLSAAKVKTMRALTRALRAGFDLDGLARLEPEAARAALTALHGIGPWTADLYLLFCLGHGDVWPAGDLALLESMRNVFGLTERPSPAEGEAIAARWRPWRGAAAHLLWAHYAHVKRRALAPLQPPDAWSPESVRRSVRRKAS